MTQRTSRSPGITRMIMIVAFSIFFGLIYITHVSAGFKAKHGIGIYLVQNHKTERAHAVWSFIESHKLIAAFYVIAFIGASLSIHAKNRKLSTSAWPGLTILMLIGIWYFMTSAYLSGKFINWSPQKNDPASSDTDRVSERPNSSKVF